MSTLANVTIHPSQFPDAVRRDLLQSLRVRRINHKFHYDSVKQTQKWLALHQAFSPAQNDPDCRAIYKKSFAAAAAQIKARRVRVIGLGCGGGQKDTRLIQLIKNHAAEVFYTPCDVSLAMVLTARRAALVVLPETRCSPLVCDLATAGDLPAIFESQITNHESRIITFFGMIPNFEPEQIWSKFVPLIRPEDVLLFSANLAPGKNYAAGMAKILSQYDNLLTRDWLMTFFSDLGVARRDGELRFTVEDGRLSLKRIVANYQFRRPCRIEVEGGHFNFRRGATTRLFFSYRYTPEKVRAILCRYGLEIRGQWITKSGEEGVFLCRRVR